MKQAANNATNFEITIVDLMKKNEKRAWIITILSLIITIVFALAIFFMLPLKEKVPFLVVTDFSSGISTVAKLQDDLAYFRVTANEMLNKSNVATYVKARESYDWELTNVNDWSTVLAMSSPDVAKTYKQQFSRANTLNPNVIFGQDVSVRTEIRNITLGFDEKNKQPVSAIVAYDRYLYQKDSNLLQPLDSNQATLTFRYNPNINMQEKYRYLNPLGFQVTRYRVDKSTTKPEPALGGSFSVENLEQLDIPNQEEIKEQIQLPGLDDQTPLPEIPGLSE